MRLQGKELGQRLQVYLVTDERADTASLLAVVEQALQGGVTTVQLRRKVDDGRMMVELGRAIRALATRYNALYIVNDRVDVALLTDADGVHVGQTDIAYQDVRRLVGEDKIIGVSASTFAEARGALQDGADYMGLGSVFPTASKPDAEVCGIDEFSSILEVVRGQSERTPTGYTPVVGIGGITSENAPFVLQAGADGVAVVSAIMAASNPADAAAAFCKLVQA